MKWFSIIVVLIAALLGGTYWWAGKDEIPLDDNARSTAPGAFMELSDGFIHYLTRGPEDGPVIVMVHGFSTPHFIYEQNASSLAANGFRVVQFDHFGRGWSDRPSAKYDADFYDRTLLEIIDRLELTEPIGLIGLSMGGLISAEFAARHPERVERVVLLVPAGLNLTGGDSLQMQITKTPIIGDWVWRVWGIQVLKQQFANAETDSMPEMNRLQGDPTIQLKYTGLSSALLSTIRNLDMSDRDETFAKLAKSKIPVLAVFGENDATIPVEAAEQMRELMPVADVRILYDNPEKDYDADHGLNYKEFEIINPWLVEFFTPMLSAPQTMPTASAITEPG